MRILHTSDWHLGKYLNNFSRHQEQEVVLNEISEIAEREAVNVVLISGDLFDTYNPPVESTELFYKSLKKLTANGRRAVIAIAGNHDSPDRIEAPDPLARECGIIFAGYPHTRVPVFELESGLKILNSDEGFFSLQIPDVEEELRVLITPYANEYRLKTYLGAEDQEAELRAVLKEKWQQLAGKYCDNAGVNILMAHLMFIKTGEAIPEEPDDEKPILHVGGAQLIYADSIPPQIQYTALGHLHRQRFVVQEGSSVVYSGSPLAYSFSEANQSKFVQLIDVLPGQPANVASVELKSGKKLLRKRSENMEEALAWLQENPIALVELTMVTDNYLTADDRKKFMNAHSGIVSLIPEVRNPDLTGMSTHSNIDLTKDLESLFQDYFLHEKGQQPGPGIMNLFKEVLSEEESV
jgi:exonuclease SbcD